MSLWRALEQLLDGIVDGQWGEPIEFHPWTGGESSVPGGTGPDPNRTVVNMTGVYMTPGAVLTGEGGTLASGMATQVETAREWVTVTEDQLGDPALWQTYDRVKLPERPTGQQWHTIERVEPSATGRFNVYLVRLQE